MWKQNEGDPILLDEPQPIGKPYAITGKKTKLMNAVYYYSITLQHVGLDQKEDFFDTLMYKLVDVGISDARTFKITVLGGFNSVNLWLVPNGHLSLCKSTICGVLCQLKNSQLMNI